MQEFGNKWKDTRKNGHFENILVSLPVVIVFISTLNIFL
jgi:hypothetical protein